MADILFSYAHEDDERAEVVVRAIRQLRWSVWWDRDIPLVAGVPYTDHITAELKQAKCVLVLWTKHSISKSWVRSEARLGLASNKLVQIADGVTKFEIPPPFFEFLFADLTGWQGAHDQLDFQRLIDGMATLCGPPGPGAVDGQEMREPKHAMGDGREDTPSPEPDIGWRGLGSLTAIEKHQQVEQPSRNDVAPPRTSSEHGTGELELPHEKFAREWDRLAPVFVKGAREDHDRSAIHVLREMKSRTEPPQLLLPKVRAQKNRRLLDAQDQTDPRRSRPLGS